MLRISEYFLDSEDAARLVNGLGYTVEYRELRACDYGAPTIRKRFFMVMRCDGKPIVWPEATHGDPKSPAVLAGKLAPWHTAAECIDWSIPRRASLIEKAAGGEYVKTYRARHPAFCYRQRVAVHREVQSHNDTQEI